MLGIVANRTEQNAMPSTETTVFRDIGIEITNLHVTFGSKTFALSDITGVETESSKANGCVPVALIAFGLLLIIGGAAGEADDIQVKAVIMLLGLLPLFGGLLMALIHDPCYAVQISTPSGEIKVFTMFDKPYVDHIVQVLNNVIVKQHMQPTMPINGKADR